ncbi:extracellular solute-binding protein [Atopomonas hussainii]|uniref:extracellular solute-binding protein n=1 Tax=Atopomonas hussainii TaxID=1429083 RepID=UPI00090020ED|nr:extracellular solute-binding protein [Atopomonas hussainii]
MQMRPLFAAVVLAATTFTANAAEELVVYSARIDDLIKPVFDAYTAKTGVKVTFITDKEAPLLARLKAEGANTPADMLITVDAGNLWQASQEDVLEPVTSKVIEANIPAQYRATNNTWTGLSLRARTLAYSTERVKDGELSTYEALGDANMEGRLCLRTSQKVYNQSLTAAMLKTWGEEKTEAVLKSWVNNLATDVFSDDTALLKAIDAGQCDVGIVNSYYYGRLLDKQPDLKVKLFWPNQADRGVHVNLSGAGVTKHAPHKAEAIKLLEWMTGPEAQSIFAELNMEFPANPSVEPAPAVKSWGGFKADTINVEFAGKLQPEAIKLMDRAGWK